MNEEQAMEIWESKKFKAKLLRKLDGYFEDIGNAYFEYHDGGRASRGKYGLDIEIVLPRKYNVLKDEPIEDDGWYLEKSDNERNRLALKYNFDVRDEEYDDLETPDDIIFALMEGEWLSINKPWDIIESLDGEIG